MVAQGIASLDGELLLQQPAEDWPEPESRAGAVENVVDRRPAAEPQLQCGAAQTRRFEKFRSGSEQSGAQVRRRCRLPVAEIPAAKSSHPGKKSAFHRSFGGGRGSFSYTASIVRSIS